MIQISLTRFVLIKTAQIYKGLFVQSARLWKLSAYEIDTYAYIMSILDM